MAQGYDIVYPAKGRVTFDGGLNNKYPRSEIADNESPDCFDVVFSNGAVETRAGSTKLNTAAVGSFAFDGVYTRHDNTGSETMVVFGGGTAWQLTGASTFTTIPSAQSVFTAGVRVGTTEYENHLFIGNGGVTPYKYNGAYFTRHGVPAPTQTATASSQATGALTGDYVYKVTYVNSQAVEGDVGPVSTTFTAASATIRLSSVPVAPQSHGVNARRIYRATSTTGSTVGTFRLVGTINDNSTTTFDDSSSATAGTTVAPTDNGEPPKYSVAVTHQNRVFMNDTANPNYVWYTDLFEPYTVASTNFQPVGDGSFDLVQGMAVYANGIIIQCTGGLYLWDMPSTDPADWRVIKIRSQYGSKSPHGTFLYDNKIMVPALQSTKFAGFAAVSGASIDPDATFLDSTTAGSDLKSDRIEPDMFNVQEAYAGHISAMVFRNKAYVSLPYGTGATANNRVYIFDFSISNLSKKQKASWTPLDGISAAQFTVYAGKLYYGTSQATGFIYQLEAGSYADDGSAIDSYFWTKEFSGLPGHENLQKDFRKVKLLVDKAGAYYMNLTYRTDSDSGLGQTQQIDLNPGSMIWGIGTWGGQIWGSGHEQEEITVSLGQVTGKRIQFKFSNQNAANQRFKVHGLNFTYNVKGRR